MTSVGIVVHSGREAAVIAAKTVAAALAARDVEVHALTDEAALCGATHPADRFPADLDLALVLGGDGTMLRAFHAIGPGVPLLGVNFGHLGFLTAVTEHDLDQIVRALDGHLVVEDRLVLAIDGLGDQQLAMNDLILEKPEPGRTVRVDVAIDGEGFVSWTTDGVIVATPTGSTAYSFSAGGPLVTPALDCLIVTPVSPHGLFDRSLVLDANERLEFVLDIDGHGGFASVDGGAAHRLEPGARIGVRAAEGRAKLARLEAQPFWRIVRDKLGVRAP